jgi:hypothetical protein
VTELSSTRESVAKQARELRVAAAARSANLAMALFAMLDAQTAAHETLEVIRRNSRLSSSSDPAAINFAG